MGICEYDCVVKGFLLRTEGVLKWSFFKVFHPLGHNFRNPVFEGRNNEALTTFLRGSARVLKQPEDNGGTYTSGTHIKMRMRQKRQYKKEDKVSLCWYNSVCN